MSRIACVAAAVLLCGALPAFAADVKLETEDQKTAYALGRLVARSLEEYKLTPDELQLVVAGLTDGATGKGGELDIDAASKQVGALHRSRVSAAQKAEGAAFVAKAAAESGAVKKPSGMIYQELKAGEGASPKAEDTVEVHYTGTFIDGTVFDSSVQRGQPATFGLDGVIPCFREGIQAMKPGGKARLVCPAETAYGDKGSGNTIRPGATLVFEVELLRVVE
jgi:FKBP-type peptidyl-prolyl cis-trans isomerase